MKRKPESIRRIGLVANLEKVACRPLVQQAAALIRAAKREVASDMATAGLAGIKAAAYPSVADLAREVDLLLVFGGDGTMLRVVRDIAGNRTPILGINAGRLGFLTAVPARELGEALQKVWNDDFVLDTRPLLEASGVCSGKSTAMYALNDIVVSHGAALRLLELDVRVDQQSLTAYRADGLIISSPTGSTAYSLSAGGPIISPDASVFVVTPICAHALSNRPIVVSLKSALQIQLVSRGVDTIIAADGQVEAKLSQGDAIRIRRSRRAVTLLHPGGGSFFDTVRRKLHWRGSYVS